MWEEVADRARTRHDARDFRTALGCFPTGVCLITALAPEGGRAGLTANSFSSVSLDPPMVLWSLSRSASSARRSRRGGGSASLHLKADVEREPRLIHVRVQTAI